LKNKFNIAVAESDYQDLWQKAQLSVVSLAASRAILENTFQQVEDFIYLNSALQISKIRIQYH